jgi:hypothetical protein
MRRKPRRVVTLLTALRTDTTHDLSQKRPERILIGVGRITTRRRGCESLYMSGDTMMSVAAVPVVPSKTSTNQMSESHNYIHALNKQSPIKCSLPNIPFTQTSLFPHPLLRHLPNHRKPKPSEPILRILPRSKRRIKRDAYRGEEEDGAQKGREGDEQVGQEEKGEQGGREKG